MKRLIPVVLLLTLGGCEQNSPASKLDGAGALASPERTTVARQVPVVVDNPLKGHVGRAGLYRLVRSGGLINDPGTSTGKSVLNPVVELAKITDRIPLIRGAQMYLQYRVWPLAEQSGWVNLRRVLKHPAITLPDGTVSTGSDYMIKAKVSAGQAIGYTGYGLDEDYELVEGDWVFQIWYGDQKMIEQTFTTYRPDKAEVAQLKPILELGNRAVGMREADPEKPFSRMDWPRIVVGGKEDGEPAGVAETKQSLDDPLNQP